MYKLDWVSISMTVFMILMILCVVSYIHYATTVETKTISGEIVDHILYDDCIELTFDTGDIVKVNLKESGAGFGTEVLDFTVNSELVVKFDKHSWWFAPNEDMWNVIQILKLPDIVEGD